MYFKNKAEDFSLNVFCFGTKFLDLWVYFILGLTYIIVSMYLLSSSSCLYIMKTQFVFLEEKDRN